LNVFKKLLDFSTASAHSLFERVQIKNAEVLSMMQTGTSYAAFHTTYYAIYLSVCALLILWLGQTLHSAGKVFLHDAFAGNETVVLAISRLLDIGFYLICFGYVAVTCRTFQWFGSLGDVAYTICLKTGGFLLVLGVAHMFNLLVLAALRRRGSSSSAHPTGA
jgi:hypothetical protein